jgi:hypothetical protein
VAAVGVTAQRLTLDGGELRLIRSAIASELIAAREMASWTGFGQEFTEGNQERVRRLEAIREKLVQSHSATLEGIA